METALSMMRLVERRERLFSAWRSQTLGRLRGLSDTTVAPTVRSLSSTLTSLSQPDAVRLVERTGAVGPLEAIASAVTAYRKAALDPYWQQFQAALEVERSILGRAFLRGGPAEAVRAAGHGLRYDGTGICVGGSAPVRTPLHGRQVVLTPSMFCRTVFVLPEDGRLLVVYPIGEHARPAALRDADPPVDGPLGNLLGHTRATILRDLGQAQTTTEVARRWGISVATASRHLTILRHAPAHHQPAPGQ